MCYLPKHVVLNILLLHISHHVFRRIFPNLFSNMCSQRTGTQIIWHHLCVSTGVFCTSAFLRVCDGVFCEAVCVCVWLNPCLYFPLIGASPGNRPNSLCIGAPEKCCQCERQGHLVTTVSLYFIIDRGLSLGSCMTDKTKQKTPELQEYGISATEGEKGGTAGEFLKL